MNTKIIATLATAATLASAASTNAQEVAFSANIGVESEYVFRGVEIAGPSIQGGFDVTFGDGYLGLWGHEALDSIDSGTSEYDLYGGWGIALDDTTTLDFGATVYHYPDADDETFEIYVGASFDTTLAPSFYVFYDFDVEALTLETSAGHSFTLSDTTSIDVGASLGYVDIDDFTDYFYWGLTADYVIALSDSVSLSIGGRYSANDRNFVRDDGNLWGGFNIAADF